MGALAFGDASTWASKDETAAQSVDSAKTSRAARFGDGALPKRTEASHDEVRGRVVSLRSVGTERPSSSERPE
jgi:hypothetical protein